jgi:hypothetical protein
LHIKKEAKIFLLTLSDKLYPVKIHILSLIAAIFMFACQPSANEAETNFSAMEFEVDPAFLGDEVQDQFLGIAYSVPLGFVEMSNLGSMLGEHASDWLKLRATYLDTASRSLLSVSDLSQMPDSVLTDFMKNPQDKFNQEGVWAKVQSDRFSYNGFKVFQVLSTNPDVVNFKLIFLEGGQSGPFQFDFLVTTEAYPRFIKSLESTIGSLRINNNL